MRCPSCHHENPAEAKFCGACGSALSRTCPGCRMSNLLANSFCQQCGQRLSAPEPPATRFSSPEDYTPQHLAAKILANRKAIARELHERLGAREPAQLAYHSAIQLIERTGEQLQNDELRRAFLAARPVQRLREVLEQLEDRASIAG